MFQADVSKQLTRLPPPPEEPIRPHGKRMVIKKGCDCEWCEAVSWDIVGELRETCEVCIVCHATCQSWFE